MAIPIWDVGRVEVGTWDVERGTDLGQSDPRKEGIADGSLVSENHFVEL